MQMVEAGTGKKRLRFNIERFAPFSQIDHWKTGLRVIPYRPFPKDRVRPENGSSACAVASHSASDPSEAPECHPVPEMHFPG